MSVKTALTAGQVKVGDFVSEVLVTDTRVYEVVAVTDKTIVVRTTRRGETLRSENRDGNPWPCVYYEAISDPDGKTYRLRLRKDGTYRTGRGFRPLYAATVIDGKPVSYTDYRE